MNINMASNKKWSESYSLIIYPCGTQLYFEPLEIKWIVEKIIIEYDNVFYKITYIENGIIKTIDAHSSQVLTSSKDKLLIWYNTKTHEN